MTALLYNKHSQQRQQTDLDSTLARHLNVVRFDYVRHLDPERAVLALLRTMRSGDGYGNIELLNVIRFPVGASFSFDASSFYFDLEELLARHQLLRDHAGYRNHRESPM